VEIREHHQVNIPNQFAALALDDVQWHKNCQNIKISAKDYIGQYEQQHRTQSDTIHSEFLDQVKHAELQWIQTKLMQIIWKM
jgi:hypothetical protein